VTKINDLEKSLAIFTFFLGALRGLAPVERGSGSPEGWSEGRNFSPLFLLRVIF
jgi:hypothetical protein